MIDGILHTRLFLIGIIAVIILGMIVLVPNSDTNKNIVPVDSGSFVAGMMLSHIIHKHKK